jgi:hypothetical protein
VEKRLIFLNEKISECIAEQQYFNGMLTEQEAALEINSGVIWGGFY